MPARTTISDRSAPCPLDRANRQFHAPAPNMLWVSDFTYIAIWAGFVYVAFVIDTFAGRIAGWRVSRSSHASFVRDLLGTSVISHDPPDNTAMTLMDFLLAHAAHGPATPQALNIKADGLAADIRRLIQLADTNSFFVFDMSVPDTLHYFRAGLPVFVRLSEYEPRSALFRRLDHCAIRLQAKKAVAGIVSHKVGHDGAEAGGFREKLLRIGRRGIDNVGQVDDKRAVQCGGGRRPGEGRQQRTLRQVRVELYCEAALAFPRPGQ
jgi:hypothetical protein